MTAGTFTAAPHDDRWWDHDAPSARVARRPGPEDARRAAGVAIPCAAAGVLAALACQTWFRPGHFIAMGDIPPLLGTGVGHGNTALWGHWAGGAGAPSYQIAGLLPALLSRIVELAGGSDVLAQRLLYTVLFAGAGAGVAYFAAAFTRRPAAVFAAGVVGAFNPFVMTNVPNPITLLVLTIVALLGGTVVRAARGVVASPVAFAVVTLGCSYVLLNPPSVLLCGGWIAALASLGNLLGGPGGMRRALLFLVRATPWVLVLNLWWIVPGAVALVGGSADLAAVTDVRDWAWTHVRSSPLNVLRLNAGWAWGHDEYFPYSSTMDHPMVVALGLLLPAAGLAAPAFTSGRARRTAAALGLMALVLMVLGTGLHAPFAAINLWLYDHVPGYWMFREPAAKFGVPLVVVYGALAALTVDALQDRWHRRGRRSLAVAAGATAVAAIAVPSIPLWTGLVIPQAREGMPSAHVALPDEWRAAAASVNSADRPGKALVLPLGDFYQMPTKWGFYGADVIAESLVLRPTISRLPGGYLGSSRGFSQLLDATEQALSIGNVSVVPRLLQSLGVSHVMVRHDFDRSSGDRDIVDPVALAGALDQVPGVRRLRPSSVVTVYEVEDRRTGMIEAYGSAVEARGAPASRLVAAATPDETVVSDDGRSSGPQRWSWAAGDHRSVLRLGHRGVFRAVVSATSTPLYSLRSSGVDGGELLVAPVGKLALGERELPVPGGAKASIPERATALRIGQKAIPLSGDEHVVAVNGAMAIEFLAPAGDPEPLSLFTAVGDCNAIDLRPPSVTGLAAVPVEGEPAAIELRAREHAACVSVGLGDHVPGTAYRLQFDHRAVAGAPPRACLWQTGPDRCATMPSLEPGSSWKTFDGFVEPDPGTSRLTLFLYADGADPATTVTQYRGATVQRLGAIDTPVTLDLRSKETEFTLAGGAHEVAYRRTSATPTLGDFSTVGDCNASDDLKAAEAGLVAERLAGVRHPAVRLRALHHSACVAAPVVGYLGPEPYRVSFDYRTTSGVAARVCLWQSGPDRCARLNPVQPSAKWRTYEETVTPLPGTTGLSLFLYADGSGVGETVNEYRSLRVVPASSFSVVVTPRSATAATPVVTVEEQGAERHRVRLDGGRGPFTIALADSFHPGWKIKGLPKDVRAEHVVVDGYANGWQIDRAVSASVVLEFVPGTMTRWAQRASVAGGLAALWFSAVRRRRRRSTTACGQTAAAQFEGSRRQAAGPRPFAVASGVALLAGVAIALVLRRPGTADALVLASIGMLLIGYVQQVAASAPRRRLRAERRIEEAPPAPSAPLSRPRKAGPRPASRRARRRHRSRPGRGVRARR